MYEAPLTGVNENARVLVCVSSSMLSARLDRDAVRDAEERSAADAGVRRHDRAVTGDRIDAHDGVEVLVCSDEVTRRFDGESVGEDHRGPRTDGAGL